MHKIKVLHIIKSLGRGGAEVLLPETLKLHRQEIFEFHYLYFLPWKNQMVIEIEEAGGVVRNFPAQNNFQMLLKRDEVITYVRKHKIDLIHCHLPWSGFLGRRIFSEIDIPVIYTEHNIQEHYHWVTKMINKYSFNFQSLAIGVSKDVSRSIKQNINPDIPVATVLNGVNTGFYIRSVEKGNTIREELGIPKRATVIGNIAVFREQKALLDWVRAFQIVHQQDPQVHGILVGAGPQEAEIKNLIQELGLMSNIKMPGLQTDTIKYFSAMDIFMMSSRFEGLPIALLEAMSMNCAIVATRAGGVVEVVEDHKSGLLCDVGDWEQLGKLCLQVINDNEIKLSLQQDARQRVVEKFSLSAMVGKLEEIYLKYQKNDDTRS